MKPCNIEYRYFDNEDQQRILKDTVEPLRFILPEWLRELTFCHVDTEEEYALKCNVRREYRLADILVRSNFFGQPRAALRVMLIHEIIHIHHAYVNDFVRCRVQDYVLQHNPDLSRAMQAEYTDHMEGFVQDFAHLIDELLGPEIASPMVFGPAVSPMEEMRVKPTPGVSRDILQELKDLDNYKPRPNDSMDPIPGFSTHIKDAVKFSGVQAISDHKSNPPGSTSQAVGPRSCDHGLTA